MDTGAVTVLVAAISAVSTVLAVRYKDYWKRPAKKTPLDILIETLSDRITTLELTVKEHAEMLDKKNEEIATLKARITQESQKYTKLLRRFNTLKAKYEKRDTIKTNEEK